MAKKSAVEKNARRKRLSEKFNAKRNKLKEIVMDKTVDINEKIVAQAKLDKLPRNSSQIRIRNRCFLSGRPRAFYRKFGISRIALRDLSSQGMIPGVTKSSW